MVLTISGWPDGQQIPVKYTQAGEQVSPELKWTNVPAGTQSFVVNMLDPDVAVRAGPRRSRTGSSGTFRRRRLDCPRA